jgi:hypothetical protein
MGLQMLDEGVSEKEEFDNQTQKADWRSIFKSSQVIGRARF